MNLNLVISLSLALVASLIIIMCLVWYIRRILDRLMFVSQNISDLESLISAYSGHLKNVHGLEQFYGDETIKMLISHTNSLLEILDDYEDISSLTVPLEQDEVLEEEIEREDEEQTLLEQEKINYGENVFYAGSRKGNN
mgnify:CR=1 FL=1